MSHALFRVGVLTGLGLCRQPQLLWADERSGHVVSVMSRRLCCFTPALPDHRLSQSFCLSLQGKGVTQAAIDGWAQHRSWFSALRLLVCSSRYLRHKEACLMSLRATVVYRSSSILVLIKCTWLGSSQVTGVIFSCDCGCYFSCWKVSYMHITCF